VSSFDSIDSIKSLWIIVSWYQRGSSENRLDLVPLIPNPQWQFNQSNIYRLLGAHGEEIVRSLYLDEQVGSHMVILSSESKPRGLQGSSGGQFSPAVKTVLCGSGSLMMLRLGRMDRKQHGHTREKQLPARQRRHKRRRTGRSPRTRNDLRRTISNKWTEQTPPN
jgi:hypothetical protein